MKLLTPFPPYITLAHSFHAPKGWAIHDRKLTQYVLQYVVDGGARYPVEGHDYFTFKGDLLFHRPGEKHSILTLDDMPYVCFSLVFHFGEHEFPLEDKLNGKHDLGNYKNHAVEHKLTQLVSLYRVPDLSAQLTCQGLLLQVLAEAAGGVRPASADTDSRCKAQMVLVKNYILSHCHEDLRLDDLEDLTGYSRNYIMDRFKKSFGLTPMQYLIQVRIQKAKELAIQSSMTVSEIARAVGYSDVHTFGKMFKKKTGLSISQFCASLVTSVR